MILAVPAVTPPVKLPLDDPIVATVVLPLVQPPPPKASVNVIDSPEHTLEFPLIGPGV